MPSGLFCTNSLYTATGSFSLLFVPNIFGAKGLISETFASVGVFVCRSLYSKNSTPSAVLFRVTSPQHVLWCSWIPRRPKWRLLFSQRELRSASGLEIPRRPLLYRTFISSSVTGTDALACCLSLVSWAVFAWSVAFCEFSQTLNCWWYQLDSFSVWGIVQNLQSYLAVMWARNHCHLWFRTKDDKDSLSDWQWVWTHSAIHWVEQEVFLQRFWALPPFEGRFLVGLRFCPSLHSCFCFLAHLWGHLLFLQGEQILAPLLPFFLFFVFTESRALFALHCEVLSFLSLIGRTMYFHSRSLFWLVCCVFRTNFTWAFFSCVNLSMFEINVFLPSPSLFRLKVQECTVFLFHRWPDIVRMSHSKNYFCIDSAKSFDTIHFEMVSIDFM